MWKLKLPEGKDRWIFLLTVGVILCILAFPVGSKEQQRNSAAIPDGSSKT